MHGCRIISVVEVGQYFMTEDTAEFSQFNAVACREYTLPRDDGSSQPRGWIQGSTKIGPVLEVTTSSLYGKHGVEIRIWSLSEHNTHSWVRISHGSNKFVIHLLRHSQKVQREDDGAVQFWRIKEHLQSQFPQIHYWSDDRWKACLAAGGGAKRIYQYCTDVSGIIVFISELFKDIQDAILLILYYRTML